MTRVLILGSCVSRDLFEYDEEKVFKLRPELAAIHSAFQRRTVGYDVAINNTSNDEPSNA